MSQSPAKGQVDPQIAQLVQANKAKRELLKYQILASLMKPVALTNGTNRVKSLKSSKDDIKPEVPSTDSKEQNEQNLQLTVMIKNTLVKELARYKSSRDTRSKDREEIEKLKPIHAASRKEIVEQQEAIRLARQKNRRLRKVLRGLQQRLIASAIVLQYQMNRKVQLAQRLEALCYYRDSVLDAAFAFSFGIHKPDPFISLGGVFSPHTNLSPDLEQELIEREHLRLSALVPSGFKSSAQSRKQNLKTLLADCIVKSTTISPLRAKSIDYSSLSKLTLMSTNLTTPREGPDHRRINSDEPPTSTSSNPSSSSNIAFSSSSSDILVSNAKKIQSNSKSTKNLKDDKAQKQTDADKRGGVFGWFSKPK